MTFSYSRESALFLILFSLAGVGCSSTSNANANDNAAAAADGGAGSDTAFVASAPWKATSARIEIASGGFFDGSMGYTKDRAGLSAAQLQALEGLRTRPDDVEPAANDIEAFQVVIHDADGTSAKYRATGGNYSGGPKGDAVAMIDKATLDPLLATLTCMKAKSVCAVEPGKTMPADCKAKVATDSGCRNGVFVSYACQDAWANLEIATPGTYEIATVDCIETVGIKVLSPDGTSVLASGAPGTKPTCSSVTHTFDAPGTFKLLIEKRNAAGCPASGGAGDFVLRVTPRP